MKTMMRLRLKLDRLKYTTLDTGLNGGWNYTSVKVGVVECDVYSIDEAERLARQKFPKANRIWADILSSNGKWEPCFCGYI